MPALKAGVRAADFALPTAGGPRFWLRENLQRGPVVLFFFVVGCPVCQYAAPYMERLHRECRDKGVTVAGISQSSKRDTAVFGKEFGLTFPVALDDPANYKVSNAYGLTNVPTVFSVGSNGEIEVSTVGWVKAEITAIHRRLADATPVRSAPLFSAEEQVSEWRPG